MNSTQIKFRDYVNEINLDFISIDHQNAARKLFLRVIFAYKQFRLLSGLFKEIQDELINNEDIIPTREDFVQIELGAKFLANKYFSDKSNQKMLF